MLVLIIMSKQDLRCAQLSGSLHVSLTRSSIVRNRLDLYDAASLLSLLLIRKYRRTVYYSVWAVPWHLSLTSMSCRESASDGGSELLGGKPQEVRRAR